MRNPTPAILAETDLPTDRPFNRAEARERGVSSSRLRQLTRAGCLHHVLGGVFVADPPDTLVERARVAALAAPDDAVVTGVTAGWVYGVDLTRPGYHGSDRSVDYARPPADATPGSPLRLEPADLRRIDDCLLTTPLRTACDLARRQRSGWALAALDGLLRLGDFTHDQLLQEVERYRGRHGINQLRELVPLIDTRAESPGESVLRRQWREAGLPTPDLQLPVVDDSGEIALHLDLADPMIKYGAEFDPEPQRSTPEQIARDDARRRAVGEDGWTIDVFDRDAVDGYQVRERLRDGHRRARERTAYGPQQDRRYIDAGEQLYGSPEEPSEVDGLRYHWSADEPDYCHACGRLIRRGTPGAGWDPVTDPAERPRWWRS